MRRTGIAVGVGIWILCIAGARGQKPPLLADKDVAVLENEISGETAKRNLEGIARFHRQRGSKGFHEAAELVAERLRAYGLSEVAILQFPADGKIFYGTQRSRPAWDAENAELTEWDVDRIASQKCVDGFAKANAIGSCVNLRSTRLGSYESEPVVLAEDSESAEAHGGLVDVGEGRKESDYEGKHVGGNFVLVSAQPGAVQDLAVGKYGAIGIISYAQNQKTAWSGENQDAIRWGHLDTFSKNKTFAFMVSLRTARALQEKLAKNDLRYLVASVKAGQHAGNYEVVTASIPGADAKLKEEEIAFSCHLDHQRPGANDNASGCSAILEVARTLQRLIDEKKLERPARTIRFIFPPEVEGTMALLNGKPEFAKRIKAVIHMDMVGGGPETKAVFHVTRGPMSSPSFVHDVAWAFADWVNEESYEFAATGKADYPMVAPEGGKEPLRAEYSAFTMGSDHDVYQDSSFGIPAIYMNDWPDRYIHTNFDSAANIDPTKLKRAAFIGAASGYFLAELSGRDFSAVNNAVSQGSVFCQTRWGTRVEGLLNEEKCNFWMRMGRYDVAARLSFRNFAEMPTVEFTPRQFDGCTYPSEGGALRGASFKRTSQVKGPLAVFGYDYFADHAKEAGIATPKLLSYEGLWGAGEEYAYEVLNFANGKRNAQEIRDAVSAEYGPVPQEMVVEYLKALEKIGIVKQVK
jgi:aminopeptidase YwaD